MNSTFESLLAEARRFRRPPVELWNPDRVVPIDFRIARDGSWFHEGDLIKRDGLVRLFASILKVEDGAHWLVTPVERCPVQVEDQPFVVTRIEIEGAGESRQIMAATNVGDATLLDSDADLQMNECADGPVPHIHIRNGLRARFGRPAWYHLADLAEEGADGFVVRSCGVNHRLA